MSEPPVDLALFSPEEKRRMLARVIRERTAGHRRYPLSYAQQRLWFLDQLAPGNPFYNQYLAVRLRQPVDAALVERAIGEIVRRHDALRTTFGVHDGEPSQLVAPALTITVPVLDLSAVPAREREAEALRLAGEEARRPFDLTAGPLVRVTLLRFAPEDHVFLLTLHHIVSDGWSLSVFFHEFETLCAAYAAGRESPLPPLAIQYSDYAVWQRDWLRGAVLDDQLAFWRHRLRGLPTLQLPADRPRPPVPTFRGGSVTRTLAQRVCEGIRALSHEERATPFMTLLTAFQVLLARYAGQDDIAVGTPVSNRTRAELEPLIGFFVNTLVMRADLSGDPTFREALRRTREVAVAAYAHQHLPFERLVEELKPARALSRNPLYQVTFQLVPAAAGPAGPESDGEPLDVSAGTALFDLVTTVYEEGARLTVQMEYSADLFEPETPRRLLDGYVSLLEGVAADADQPIRSLPVIAAADRHRLLATWNDTRAAYERPDDDVAALVDAWCAATPTADAVVHSEERLSYGALGDRAARIAGYLARQGVAPGDAVAVSLPRSTSWIAATLAVWRLGAVYVPIDPALPARRQAWLEHECGAAVALTAERLAEALRAAPDDVSAPRAAGLDRVAYVIYTSGSTGTPKGVEVTHRGLRNLVEWHRGQYRVRQGDHASQVAAASFDASLWEVWPYLAAGACVHVYDRELVASASAVVERLARDGIDLCFLPTPLAERALDLEWPAGTRLRALLTGGDVLHPIPRRALPFAVVNHYGPTECSVVATSAPVRPGDDAVRLPPIGRPIANTRVYVVDAAGELAMPGAAGELCLTGDGLAAGYRNRPALTAAQFVPCPFEGGAARMYRTGDLVRHRADGELEFLGRLDQQLKIRGFRIEPAEVESALLDHPAVCDAAVVASGRDGEERELAAYVTIGAPTTDVELRRHLRERLPEYMVPSTLRIVDALPLNASGKVDRSALTTLPARPAGLSQGPSAMTPQTAMERSVARAWQEVLGVPAIGVHDNFFDLGGHSLLLVKLQASLQESLGVPVRVVDLFRHPTVSSLAAALVRSGRSAGPVDAVSERAARHHDGRRRFRPDGR